MNNLALIAAIGKNRELGRNNQLIWRIHEDMQFFRQVTMERSIVMGRKTFESLPGILPYRKHIVLTSQDVDISGVMVMHHKDEVLQYASSQTDEVIVIGGGKIYQLFLDDVFKMYLTEIDDECKDADVFFPYFNSHEWNREVLKTGDEDGIGFQHVQYVRKRRFKR